MLPLSVKRQTLIFATSLVLLVLSSLFAFRLQFDNDIRRRFLPDDPAMAALAEEEGLFGKNEGVYLLVASDQPILTEGLQKNLEQLKRALLTIPGTKNVFTPFDSPVLLWESTTQWSTMPVGETPAPQTLLPETPWIQKNFFRRDGQGVALLIELEGDILATSSLGQAWMKQANTMLAQQKLSWRPTLAGALPFQTQTMGVAQKEALIMGIILVIVFLILLTIFFRSFKGAVAVLGVGCLSITATFGLIGLSGLHLSPYTLFAIPVILAVSLLDNIHVFYGYRLIRSRETSPQMAIAKTWAELFFPCLGTAITTMAGFCSLLIISVPQIRQFGAVSALGCGIDFLATFSLLPTLLAHLDPRAAQGMPVRWCEGLRRLPPKPIVIFAVATFLVTLPGLFIIKIKPDFPDLLRHNHPITATMHALEEKWGGMATISYLLTLKPPHDWRDPEVGLRLQNFIHLLEQRPLITHVISPLDILAAGARSFTTTFDQAMGREEKNRWFGDLLEQKLPPALVPWINIQDRTLRIVARVKMMAPEHFPKLARDLYGFQKNLSDLFATRLTGWPLLFKNMERRLLAETFKGFALAFALIDLVLLLVVLRSCKLWGLALLPNLWPLVIVFGGLALAGHGFSSGLLLAPAIAMGLVVDDTIHFVTNIRRHLQNGYEMPSAIQQSLRQSGSAILLTSIILMVGFVPLLFSAFKGNQELAVVMIGIILLALACELILLPAMLLWQKR